LIALIPAGLVHADLLAGIHRICFAEPWSATSMAEVLALAGTEGLIAVDGRSLTPAAAPPGPAGLILWRRIFDEAEILTVAVLPPWRRRGLGAQLLDRAMAAAAEGGALTMFLEAAADNQAALALYASREFQQVGLRKGYYGAIDGVTMSCRLDKRPVAS
jgi:[ribosomal protein S18]-alanine N-acetyltransferase